MAQDYVFGYGSLIEKESRKRTTPEAEDARPAVVLGVSRGWWDRTPSIGFTTTFLGAVEDASARCNGVVYPVTPDQLAKTDERESGYDRKPIAVDKVTMLDGSATDKTGRYWIYLSRRQLDATAEFPIVQSYVDICVNGCIEVEADYPAARKAGYTELFMSGTARWSRFWVNDRIYPRRPFIYRPNAGAIDAIIQRHYPELFAGIQIEPARW